MHNAVCAMTLPRGESARVCRSECRNRLSQEQDRRQRILLGPVPGGWVGNVHGSLSALRTPSIANGRMRQNG